MLRSPLGTALATPLAVLALGATPVAAAPATAVHSDAALAVVVHADRACAPQVLNAGDRALLALRFGTAGRRGVPAATAAAQLHLSPAAFTLAEYRAVRRLEIAHRAGRCDPSAGLAAGGVQSFSATHPAPTTPAATATSSGLSWTSPTELALLAVIVLALGALVYGLRRDFGRPRVADWGPTRQRRWTARLGSRRRRGG
jgi:hypothetical protein